ncbi:MAG: hypothetical protein QG608_3474 [Actinomycetota bacterium]|nr:hypothetical protein [Actinomycetota bacterium]
MNGRRTSAVNLETLVEEPSAKVALDLFLPRLLPDGVAFTVHAFEGRHQLLTRLEQRLHGFRHYGSDTRILVLIDRDNDDCRALKEALERAAATVGLPTLAESGGPDIIRVCNRIVCEELEAWFLGDPKALCTAYPKVKPGYASGAKFRDPDAITGGTWEALLDLLKKAGYYRDRARLPKTEIARAVAPYLVPDRNTSPSFRAFVDGTRRLVGDLR